MVVDRYGKVQTFEGSPDTHPASPDDFVRDFRITERQFTQMSEWGEADAHLARLADTPAHAQLARTPIEQYDTARQCLATLDRLGINSEQERYQYIRFACAFPATANSTPPSRPRCLRPATSRAPCPRCWRRCPRP